MATGKTNIQGGGGGLAFNDNVIGQSISYSNQHVSKTGKGVLTGITNLSSIALTYVVIADGVTISCFVREYSHISLSIPYDTSLVIKSYDWPAALFWFALGSHDIKKSTPQCVKYNFTTVATTTLRKSITGAGILHVAQSYLYGIKIVVDGTTLIDYDSSPGVFLFSSIFIRFNTSLDFYVESVGLGESVYVQYSLD